MWGERGWEKVITAVVERDSTSVQDVDLIRLREHDRASLLGVNVGLVAAMAARIEAMKAESPPEDGDATARY